MLMACETEWACRHHILSSERQINFCTTDLLDSHFYIMHVTEATDTSDISLAIVARIRVTAIHEINMYTDDV